VGIPIKHNAISLLIPKTLNQSIQSRTQDIGCYALGFPNLSKALASLCYHQVLGSAISLTSNLTPEDTPIGLARVQIRQLVLGRGISRVVLANLMVSNSSVFFSAQVTLQIQATTSYSIIFGDFPKMMAPRSPLLGVLLPNRINPQAYRCRCSFHLGVFQGIESTRNDKCTSSDCCLSKGYDGSEEVQI
jgi:hypothetical protein